MNAQIGFLSFVFVWIASSVVAHAERLNERETDFNFDWHFTLTDQIELPHELPLDDRDWRQLNLPHDWSIEADFSENLEGATGYLPGGVGLYQKRFPSPSNLDTQSVFIVFDGVYNNANFYLNGEHLGENPYGYSPVYFELTPHLNRDGTENVLTVHVDRTRYADSRWYTGSGIYRNVRLITVDRLHVPIWGVFVSTPDISDQKATVSVEVEVQNDHSSVQSFDLVTQIIAPSGKVVAETDTQALLQPGEKRTFEEMTRVSAPRLWRLEEPDLYTAITSIEQAGDTIDQTITKFGIRSIEFRADEGFFLNGVPTLMKGVSLHHDAGLVGAAVPKGVWRRRLEKLKEGGVNAVRTAHNPFSKEFLELCDEMGLLVQNEIFDEFDYPKDKRLNYHDRHDDYITRGYTEHFQDWAKSDLTRTMLRDRNHPSVIQWSIGNEIEWAYVDHRFVTGFWNNPDDPMEMDMSFWGAAPKFTPAELKQRFDALPAKEFDLAQTAHKLSGWVRALDPTRPITANMILPQVSHVSGYADAVDIVGYSYRNPVITWGREHFPDKPISIHENQGTWQDWQQVLDHPGVYSIFMWTGIDYIGERHDKWPEKSGWGDMLDLAGFKKQGWNYFKSIWVDEPHISLGTLPLIGSGFSIGEDGTSAIPESGASLVWRDSNMHWNYQADDLVLVEVATNHPSIELFLNERSLGTRQLSNDDGRIMRWVVPFEPGRLTARSVSEEKPHNSVLETTGAISSLRALSDKAELRADGYDVAHIELSLFDLKGRQVHADNVELTIEVTGAANLLGVDNGAPDNVQGFKTNKIMTHRGRALAIIQTTRAPGLIEVSVSADGMTTQKLILRSVD